MNDSRQRGTLRRVGALWKPKPGAKSLGSGSVTINGLRQRFVVLRNERKKDGSNAPDYVLMSGDEPEADEYARRGPSAGPTPGRDPAAEPFEASVDDIPFAWLLPLLLPALGVMGGLLVCSHVV